jgi:hypothetical protein
MLTALLEPLRGGALRQALGSQPPRSMCDGITTARSRAHATSVVPLSGTEHSFRDAVSRGLHPGPYDDHLQATIRREQASIVISRSFPGLQMRRALRAVQNLLPKLSGGCATDDDNDCLNVGR